MNNSDILKIVVMVPESHADVVRDAMGKAGAGKIGNYSYCSFSTKGISRFKPEEGARPNIGEVGEFESVVEERIETICERNKVADVKEAVKKVHPYEEVSWDIWLLEEI